VAPRRILLLSAYDAESHRQWRRGVVEHFPDDEWVVLTQPARHFAWRSRGNALYWALEAPDLFDQPFDAVLATSMVDLAVLRGLVPAMGRIPCAVYFHENQFVYPERPGHRRDVNFGLTNLYTALAADRIAFNSAFNRDSFLEGITSFLAQMPDQIPASVTERIAGRSIVLPVPLAPADRLDRPQRADGPLRILWNHRWEYDKAPERFFNALMELANRGRPFRLHVLGQSFRTIPPIFERARRELGEHIDSWGYMPERADYEAVLGRCDLVVSTALHEFQGLSMLEAVAAGCHPLAPRRLAYPEYFPSPCLYDSHPDDPETEKQALVAAIEEAIDQVEILRETPAPDVSALYWGNLKPAYEAFLRF
jgi:glycosyltransferase involved in cell wall biosynthesis